VNDDDVVDVPTGHVVACTYLGAIHPNPFPNRATIHFGLKDAGPVRLRVFDIGGRMVRSLRDGHERAGERQIVWDGLDGAGNHLASGFYVLRLEANGKILTRSVRVIR
jgi:hypothetical protein